MNPNQPDSNKPNANTPVTNQSFGNEDLKALVDGELSPAQETEALRILEAHPEQQKEVIYLREITRMLKTEIEQAEPVGLEETLKALETNSSGGSGKVPAKPTGSNFFARFGAGQGGLIWAGVAAVLVLAFGLKSLSPSGPNSGGTSANAVMADSMSKAPSDAPMNGNGVAASPASTPPMTAHAGKPLLQDQAKSDGTTLNSSVNGFFGDGRFNESFGGSRFGASANRQIARTAQMTVAVTDVAQAASSAESLLTQFDAQIELSDVHVTPAQPNPAQPGMAPIPESSMADIEADVPTSHLEEVVTGLSRLGKLRAKTSRASDVTDRVQDIDKELKAVQRQFDDDGERLKSVSKVKDVKRLKELQSQARQQLRDLTAEKKQLDTVISMSHVSLVLTSEPASLTDDTWHQATKSLGEFGNVVLQFLIFALVWTPVWLPLGLVANYYSKRSSPKA
jgi:hypothetical protein